MFLNVANRFPDIPVVANRRMFIEDEINTVSTKTKTNFCVLTALGFLSLGGAAALFTLLLTGGVGSDLSWVALGGGVALYFIGSAFLISMCRSVANGVFDVKDLTREIQNIPISFEELLFYFTTAPDHEISQKIARLDNEEFPFFVDAIKDYEFEPHILEAITQSSYERGLCLPPLLLAALKEDSLTKTLLRLFDIAPVEDQQEILEELVARAARSEGKKQQLIVAFLERQAQKKGQDLPDNLLDTLCKLSTTEFLVTLSRTASREDKKRLLEVIAHRTYDKDENLPPELLDVLLTLSSIETLLNLTESAPEEDWGLIMDALEHHAKNPIEKEKDLPPRLLNELLEHSTIEYLTELAEHATEEDKARICKELITRARASYQKNKNIGQEDLEKMLPLFSIDTLISLFDRAPKGEQELLGVDKKLIVEELARRAVAIYGEGRCLSRDHLLRLRNAPLESQIRLMDHAIKGDLEKILYVVEMRICTQVARGLKLSEEVLVGDLLSILLKFCSSDVLLILLSKVSEENREVILEALEKRANQSYREPLTFSSDGLATLLKYSSKEALIKWMHHVSIEQRNLILVEVARKTYQSGQNLKTDLFEELMEKTPNNTLEKLRGIAPHDDEEKINHILMFKELGVSTENKKEKEKEKVEKEEEVKPPETKEVDETIEVPLKAGDIINIRILERASSHSANSVKEDLDITEE